MHGNVCSITNTEFDNNYIPGSAAEYRANY